MTATPAPPSVIVVGPFRYRVVTDPAAIRAAEHEANDTLHAQFDEAAERILLDVGVSPGFARDSLLHEVLHSLLHLGPMAGILGKVDDDLEEQVVRALSGGLLDVLRRNPKLVAYLLAK